MTMEFINYFKFNLIHANFDIIFIKRFSIYTINIYEKNKINIQSYTMLVFVTDWKINFKP